MAGCGPSTSNVAQAEDGAESSELASRAFDVESYALRGEFDWVIERLNGQLTITFDKKQAVPARVLLDCTVEKVNSVKLPDGKALAFRVDQQAGTLTVFLGKNAVPGASFVVDYRAKSKFDGEVFNTPALTSISKRKGDPIQSRVASTFSEPRSARAWLPSHDDPSDRAHFSADFALRGNDRLISNGDLVEESPAGSSGVRHMKYQTSYSLPTYLMAIAVGDFEVQNARGPNGLPLSIWHRPGLTMDEQLMLRKISGMVATFERLTGVKYPFEKYALVLVPSIGFGGEEHASITFQTETFSNQATSLSDLSLVAHELGHQWFGDLVTVATWDDLWLKEGMATLIEREGVKELFDENARGPALEGDFQLVSSGEAIRDPKLRPEEKYTTGPYSRASWLLSQIRVTIGEAAFWGTWREVLTKNRFGTMSTDSVLAAFRPKLSSAFFAKVVKAIDGQFVPSLDIVTIEDGARVTLTDPDGALLVPMQATWFHADGTRKTIEFSPGKAVELKRERPDDLLVIDEDDIHPAWFNFALPFGEPTYTAYLETVIPFTLPLTAVQRERFLTLKSAHQVAALSQGPLASIEPAQFEAFFQKTASSYAKGVAVLAACATAKSNPDPWRPVLLRVFQRREIDAALGLYPFLFADCGEIVTPEQIARPEWLSLKAGLKQPVVDDLTVEVLARVPTKAPEMLQVWSAVAKNAYSLRARNIAAATLERFGTVPGNVVDADKAAWRKTVADLLQNTAVVANAFPYVSVLNATLGPKVTDNVNGREALAEVLRTPQLEPVYETAACSAFQLSAGDDKVWQAFVAELKGRPLNDATVAVFANPTEACGLTALSQSRAARAVAPSVKPPLLGGSQRRFKR